MQLQRKHNKKLRITDVELKSLEAVVWGQVSKIRMRPEHTVTKGYMKSHMKSIKKEKKLKSDGTKRGSKWISTASRSRERELNLILIKNTEI
jgi:hypothetical protein